MTSTPFQVGISESRRPTSRVLHPPGGRQTDIFSNEPESPRYGRRQAYQVQAALMQENEAATAATNGTKYENPELDTPEAGNATPDVIQEVMPDNASLTIETAAPELIDEPQMVAPESSPALVQTVAAAPTSDTTAASVNKRVRVPPGGFSSKLW